MIDGVSVFRIAGMLAFTIALTAFAAVFDDWPIYKQIPDDKALIKLSFSHGSDRKSECRRYTKEELAEIPPNMRRPMKCPRGRRPVVAELDIDGKTIFAESLPPSGFAGDGPSRVYKRFVVEPGEHTIAARLRDTAREEGFDYETETTITLAPRQNFVIDFQPNAGGFVLH